eukprot:123008-Chlamydomonas_euryale.AAC.2
MQGVECELLVAGALPCKRATHLSSVECCVNGVQQGGALDPDFVASTSAAELQRTGLFERKGKGTPGKGKGTLEKGTGKRISGQGREKATPGKETGTPGNRKGQRIPGQGKGEGAPGRKPPGLPVQLADVRMHMPHDPHHAHHPRPHAAAVTPP